MLYIVGVLTVLLSLHADLAQSQAVCGTPPVVWRNDNITCPTRAVCADVFIHSRDWYNGTVCAETRVLSNCLCPGNLVCPFNNDNHMLYNSMSHRMFICEPKCQLPWCENVRREFDSYDQPRRQLVVAQTSEQQAREFGHKNYNRMLCRCPRHHFPVTGRRGRSRSTKASRYRYVHSARRYSIEYVCNNGPPSFRSSTRNQEPLDDPCPPRNLE